MLFQVLKREFVHNQETATISFMASKFESDLKNQRIQEQRSNFQKFVKILGLCCLWIIMPFTAFAKMQELMDEKGARKAKSTK